MHLDCLPVAPRPDDTNSSGYCTFLSYDWGQCMKNGPVKPCWSNVYVPPLFSWEQEAVLAGRRSIFALENAQNNIAEQNSGGLVSVDYTCCIGEAQRGPPPVFLLLDWVLF